MSADDFGPAPDLLQISDFSTDVDLTSVRGAAYPSGPARSIKINSAGSGTLAVVTAGSRGSTRILTVAAGDEYICQATAIKAATNVALVTVFW